MEGSRLSPTQGELGKKQSDKFKGREEAAREIFRRGYALGLESKLYLANLEKRKGEIFDLIRKMEREGIISEEEGKKSFIQGYSTGERDGEEIMLKKVEGEFSKVLEKAFEIGGEEAGKILVASMREGVRNPKEVIYELIETIFPLLDYIINSGEEFSEELIENLREVLLPFYWFLMEGDFEGLKEILMSYWSAIDREFGMPLPMGG